MFCLYLSFFKVIKFKCVLDDLVILFVYLLLFEVVINIWGERFEILFLCMLFIFVVKFCICNVFEIDFLVLYWLFLILLLNELFFCMDFF